MVRINSTNSAFTGSGYGGFGYHQPLSNRRKSFIGGGVGLVGAVYFRKPIRANFHRGIESLKKYLLTRL